MVDDPYDLLSKSSQNNLIKTDALEEWLSLFLTEAENLFGPRLNPYPLKFAGITFGGNRPRINFLKNDEGEYSRNEVSLTKGQRRITKEAFYWLCHESVHLLSPIPYGDTMLEEGMACWYQHHWLSKCP